MIPPVHTSRSRRPSPALIVALLALFAALAGTGWAAVTINGAQLRNRSVSRLKIRRNTLTGAEIKERTLGLVPRAQSARNASSLGGYPAADYTQNVWAVESSRPLTLGSGDQGSTLLEQKFVNDAPKSSGLLDFAEVEATNTGKVPETLTLHLKIDDEVEPGSFTGTIAPGDTQSLAAVLKCNGIALGSHTVQLLGDPSGPMQIGTRDEFALRPIVVPPGHSLFTTEAR